MTTTPYFTNPNAMRVLGKRLFKVAVDLSRLDDRSKTVVENSIRAVKGRKMIYFKRAVHEVTQLRDDMIIARRDRHWRRAGRTILHKFYIGPAFRYTSDPYKAGPFPPAKEPRPLLERLHEYKKAKRDRIEHEHLSALGQHFDRAYKLHHHVEFTLTDDPAAVCFEGRSKRKPHEYCRIWTQTESHWNVVLPRYWWDNVRWLHEKIANVYSSIAVLDCQFIRLRVINSPSDRSIYGHQDVIEDHWSARIARQKRGFRITTEDAFIVQRSLLNPSRSVETIVRYGPTIEQAIANVDKGDYYIRTHKNIQRQQRREARQRQLTEALETLKLVQSGHRSIHNLNEREKLDLLRVVQDQIANAQKRTATFGGIGQRAIHADPACASA